jgi:glycosyltransferase involved in cell wall biosynthesis
MSRLNWIEALNSVPRIVAIAHKQYPGGVRERREIEALLDAGYEIDVICLRQPGQLFYESSGKLRVYRIPLSHRRTGKIRFMLEYSIFFILSLILLSLFQLRRHYRIVQVHNIPDFLVFGAIVPKILGARILLDIRDPMPETFQYKFGLSEGSFWITLMQWIEKVAVKFSDHVLAVHEPLREIHIRRGCPPERISAIMNLPDENIFVMVSDFHWPNSTPPNFNLIYTGTIGKRHGIQTALKGLPILIKAIPGINLRIIGEGEYLEELKRLARNLGVYSHVSFELPIPLDRIPHELQRSDVGIALQEGLFGELAFPTKVGEYMAMNIPAIVSKTSITQKYFCEDMVAFIPPGDVMAFVAQVRKLYSDSVYGRNLALNGQNFLKEYNWASEKVRYLEIVRNLISS